MRMNDDLNAIFSQDGLLSKFLPGYLPRDAQLLMAQKIEQCLQNKDILLCEAGTGTGKTYAYLIPAVLSSKQIIISTGTKNLQDQLYQKDLPVIASLLETVKQRKLNYHLLKGRSNYICRYRFEKALDESWYDEETLSELQIINLSIRQTEHADIAEFDEVKEQSSVWPLVTSTADNCLGKACPVHDECYVLKAREQAFEADILIVNHHLLMADLKLKNDALGELLPSAHTYIIDEAHQLPEVASRFFSQQISTRQIKELLKESRRFLSKSTLPMTRFIALNDDIRRILDDLLMVIKRYKSRGNWSEISLAVKPLCDEVVYGLRKLKVFFESLIIESSSVRAKTADRDYKNVELERCFKRCEQLLLSFDELTGNTPKDMIHWFECHSQSVSIQLTPLSVGEEFIQQLDSTSSNWIFTSATLTVHYPDRLDETEQNKSQDKSFFAHFASQLALNDYNVLKLDSPFDFNQQAILYVPQNLPMPSDERYTSTMIRSILPVIEWLGGKTFFLFTSYRALREAKEILKIMDFHLFVQGDAPKQQLVNQFKNTDNAVLLGTSSFWEGVDVKGKALSCVVIDKLPFASPYEPVLQAKINLMKQQGINAFYQYQLPQAGMALKQGVGRLIRDVNDSGILVIADPRLFNKSYGYYLRKTLPKMPIETDLAQLKEKFSGIS